MSESSEYQKSSTKGKELGGRKYSRKDFLKLAGATVASTMALGGAIKVFLTLFPPEEVKRRISEKRLRAGDLSSEQKRFFKREIIDKIFTEPTHNEIDSAYGYFDRTIFKIERRLRNVVFYSLETPDNLRGRCAVALNRSRINRGEVVWFLEGTPPGPFAPNKVYKEGSLSVPGTHGEILGPSILLGEPNQGGFESKSPDFAENTIKSLHGKSLAAFGLWKLLSQGEINLTLPKGPCLEISGYSGGANAALVVATRFPEDIRRLFSFSSSYNLLHPYFKERAVAALEGRETFNWLSLWVGKPFFLQALRVAKSNETAVREAFINSQVDSLRTLLLRGSPYYWVERIPPNSFIWELAHGRNDQLMPFVQTEQLVSKLANLGWDSDHLRVFCHEGDHFSVGKGEVFIP